MSSSSGAGNGQFETATVANGCFWGTQHIYDKHFKGRLEKTEVGYTGGKTESPSYRQVCMGTTNHAEACRITFDPAKVGYAELIEFFFRTHDPTQMNGQGPDRGTQYRSAIFYHSPEQKEIANKVMEEIKDKHPLVRQGGKIATEITEAGKWWDGEDYHQEYLDNNPGGYECPTHRLWW
ncbi:hypothetical protein BT93_L0854 [Corymbia citriodora subsp. variegata]|uniref:peptide-methionine (S)-S-oxide reductase n=1 Tax=Corymbia citriodora subsp. variegata TaxID=360336 RepID=A0A8T0CEJ7_CORYI|nr:hypothetical protein BT93_L0854 [Corymbia citriodora subsp. variegata]